MLLESGLLPLDDVDAQLLAEKVMIKMTARAARDGISYERVGIQARLDAVAVELAHAEQRHALADGAANVAIAANALAIVAVAHDKLVKRLAHIDAELRRVGRLSDRKLAAERGRA